MESVEGVRGAGGREGEKLSKRDGSTTTESGYEQEHGGGRLCVSYLNATQPTRGATRSSVQLHGVYNIEK